MSERAAVMRCTFCDKSKDDVAKLVFPPQENVYICDECIVHSVSMLICENPPELPGDVPLPTDLKCTYCHKRHGTVAKLFSSPAGNAFICNECILYCVWMLTDKRGSAPGQSASAPRHPNARLSRLFRALLKLQKSASD